MRHAGGRVGEYDEVLGYHLEQAYRFRTELGPADAATEALGERAARHLEAAANRAAERSDLRAAAGLLERALDVGIAEPLKRAYARFELADYLGGIGRSGERASIVDEVAETAERLGDRALGARVAVSRVGSVLHEQATRARICGRRSTSASTHSGSSATSTGSPMPTTSTG